MKFLILILAFASTSFAASAQFQSKVVELLNESVYFGDIVSFSNLEFVGTNIDSNEVYKLNYEYPVFGDGSFQHGGMDIDEIIGTESTCEYIYFDEAQNDFLFTGFECSADASKVLGKTSEFLNNEAEISKVLQTDSSFSFVVDYDAPTFIQILEDEINGNLEIYKIEYVNNQNLGLCEYITFDPEINFLTFTGVSCDQPVDEVIEENLREID